MTRGDRPHVLLALHAAGLCDELQKDLAVEGYDVTVAADAPAALAAARDVEPDLVVLDVILAGGGGIEVCERLRVDDGFMAPIILLATGGIEPDFMRLTWGADDYLAAPITSAELARRVGSVLRRSLVPPGPRPLAGLLTDGDLALNPVSRLAMRGGASLRLTTRELDLLHFLLRHPRKAFRPADLMRLVWGWEYADSSTIAIHVDRLRLAVERDPAAPQHLVTVAGVGYRWDPTPT